ncbi:jasmonate-induced oxygenase 2-like [Humulus lupulus]|uniref:jasmonate-induced oxygenase 2-like n=1 Tax=Humulus lupulus TaxID=3486 RepID=UPI002B4054D3|nr:jasmonate-induced oxygenase 2-like [Humulus lupulus]XP_062105187.1 jasmonate-induced oxygenase 2-like [Humulus lupulus]
MGEAIIDPGYIQEEEHRPKLVTPHEYLNDEEIPVIDLSIDEDIVARIGGAAEKWGFFQVINHGVSNELIAKIEELAFQFFNLPEEEKKKVKRDEVNPAGFHDYPHTKNVRDWKQVFNFFLQEETLWPTSYEDGNNEVMVLTNQWPDYPPQLRQVCQEYGREMNKLAFRLLGLIAKSLGLGEKRFDELFKEQMSLVRFNYYPPCPVPDLALGVGRHKDSVAITILGQDSVGGLQVRRKSDQEWIPVKPIPYAFIINIGDLIQVWSNGKIESVEHRAVVNTEKARFSLPFFFAPGQDLMVKPLEELLNGEPPKYKTYNWGKFFANRNHGDFKKRDIENIQITHFTLQDK